MLGLAAYSLYCNIPTWPPFLFAELRLITHLSQPSPSFHEIPSEFWMLIAPWKNYMNSLLKCVFFLLAPRLLLVRKKSVSVYLMPVPITCPAHCLRFPSSCSCSVLCIWLGNLPQRRALFWHLNFQNLYETFSFLHYWIRHLLRATAACNFFHLSSGQMAPHPPL